MMCVKIGKHIVDQANQIATLARVAASTAWFFSMLQTVIQPSRSESHETNPSIKPGASSSEGRKRFKNPSPPETKMRKKRESIAVETVTSILQNLPSPSPTSPNYLPPSNILLSKNPTSTSPVIPRRKPLSTLTTPKPPQ